MDILILCAWKRGGDINTNYKSSLQHTTTWLTTEKNNIRILCITVHKYYTDLILKITTEISGSKVVVLIHEGMNNSPHMKKNPVISENDYRVSKDVCKKSIYKNTRKSIKNYKTQRSTISINAQTGEQLAYSWFDT